MEEFKGLSRDTTRVKTPTGMWEFARNILLTKGFTSVSNEYGFVEQVNIPGEVIGVISTNEETVVFSIENDFSRIGYFNNEDLEYIPVIRSAYLGFKISNPIEGIFFYNYNKELIIVFCDGIQFNSNTPKLINLTPNVARPVSDTSLILKRIMTPLSVITMISSSPFTVVSPANGPFFSVIFVVFIPFPPRPLIGYSLAAVCLPYPFSEITKTLLSGSRIAEPIT